jgi:hypothetical protein
MLQEIITFNLLPFSYQDRHPFQEAQSIKISHTVTQVNILRVLQAQGYGRLFKQTNNDQTVDRGY